MSSRSTIVNLEYVEPVEEWSHLSYRLYLRGSSEPVAMSWRYTGRLKRQPCHPERDAGESRDLALQASWPATGTSQ
jgi:hypothetical protein